MTRSEAYMVFYNMYLADTYLEGFGFDEPDTFEVHYNDIDIDEIIDYLQSLSVSFNVVKQFVSGDIAFDTIDSKHTGDDFDYLVLYKDDNGCLGMYAWTEVLGITYDIKDYGIKWKERKY